MDFIFVEKLIDSTRLILRKNLRYIFLFALLGLICGLFYAMVFYSPSYTASATILLNNPGKSDVFSGVIGTQMEILKSGEIAQRVLKEINSRHNFDETGKKNINDIKTAISVENPFNTSLIRLTAIWDNPEIARDIVATAINEYRALNNETAKQVFSRTRKILEQKVKNEEENLLLIANSPKAPNMKDAAITGAACPLQTADYSPMIRGLKTKLIDLELAEAQSVVGVNVINTPEINSNCIFPGKFQLALLIAISFGYIAMKFIFMREFFKNSYSNAEQMEKETGTTVLSSIPWLDKEVYEEPDTLFAIGETASSYSISYQKAVSSIRILGNTYGKRILGFTSSESSKIRSTIIMNVACGLSRTAQSVIVIDADFRTPTIAKEADIELNRGYNLENLLEEISTCIKTARPFDESRVGLYIRSARNIDNLFILPNTSNMPDPSEFLYSDAFSLLIRVLRKKYDWVLIDTPPVLAVPDAIAVSSHTDGMIVMTGLETSKQVLRKVFKLFESCKIGVFGIIAREQDINRSFSTNEYIRQMFARLMQQNDSLLAEQ